MKPTVLLIDDEMLVAEYYKRALKEQGLEVKRYYGPDTAFEFLEKEKPNIALAVLDIMMLPGRRYEDKDTDEGLTTGVLMYDEFRSLYPDVPVIVLTNASNPTTAEGL